VWGNRLLPAVRFVFYWARDLLHHLRRLSKDSPSLNAFSSRWPVNPTVGDYGRETQTRARSGQGQRAGPILVWLCQEDVLAVNARPCDGSRLSSLDVMTHLEACRLIVPTGPRWPLGTWVNGAKFITAYVILKGRQVASRVFKHTCNETSDGWRISRAARLWGARTPVAIPAIGSPICEDAWTRCGRHCAETGAEFLWGPRIALIIRGSSRRV